MENKYNMDITVRNTCYRRLLRISLQVMLLLGVVSCQESFPDIYMDMEDGAPSPYPENGEEGRVPITPSFTDPVCDIYTRGYGQLDPYEQDKEHWDNAVFHTFALLTANRYSGSERINYSLGDETHRLLWNQKMKIKHGAEDNIIFVDDEGKTVTKFYSWPHQNYKYNFFTYYVDDAKVDNLTADAKTVKVQVTIDGTQDVLHAFAFHSRDNINAWIERKQKDGGEDYDKPIMEDISTDTTSAYPQYDYFYSTMAGHRGVNPHFHANHLLTGLRFMVRGVKSDNTTVVEGSTGDGGETKRLPDSYQQIVVRRVSVDVPYVGWMTVADDAWSNPEEYVNAIANRQVLTFNDNITKELEVVLDTARATDYYTWLKDDKKYQENPYKDTDAQWHVNSESNRYIGKTIMIPPCESVRVKLETDFLDIATDGKSLNTPIVQLNPIFYTLKYSQGGFEPGHEYTVIISVYGAQQIQGSLELNSWIGNQDDLEAGDNDGSGDHVVSVGEDDEEFE